MNTGDILRETNRLTTIGCGILLLHIGHAAVPRVGDRFIE
jgi:hypothetical protein